MNCLKNIDIIEDRNNIIQTYQNVFDNMNNPVGVTFNLRNTRKTKDKIKGTKSITLDQQHLEHIWNRFSGCMLNATYPRFMRKMINRPPLLIGGFEYGDIKEGPHIHCIVNNVDKSPEHQMRWIIKECIIKTKRYTSWLGDNIHFEDSIDRKFVSYFLKGSSFVSLYC